MKVLCIDNSNPIHGKKLDPEEWVEEGKIYTVVDAQRNGYGLFYMLAEKRKVVSYHSRRFIPVSDADDTDDAKAGKGIKMWEEEKRAVL